MSETVYPGFSVTAFEIQPHRNHGSCLLLQVRGPVPGDGQIATLFEVHMHQGLSEQLLQKLQEAIGQESQD